MPHFRATVQGLPMEKVDGLLREARVGVATASDVSNAANASGTQAAEPELESVKVSVDATDVEEARWKLEEALPGATSIEVLG